MKYVQVQLTIGHNVEGTPTHTIHHVCAQVEDLLGIKAYTAIPCLGMWQGIAEDSTRIEIVTTPDKARVILANVAYLAHALKQEAIMTHYAGQFDFVEAATPALAIRYA